MKKIKLMNSDKEAMVDDEDYEYLNQFQWFLTKKGFAAREDVDGARIYMHDEVLNRTANKNNRPRQ